MLRNLSRLPRAVWLIGLISMINDTASEMLYPLIPLYLSSVLMAGPKAMGLIEGIAEATASLLKLFFGVIVDRTRRAKPCGSSLAMGWLAWDGR
jgi:Na+/melibiose symporter-like transporter